MTPNNYFPVRLRFILRSAKIVAVPFCIPSHSQFFLVRRQRLRSSNEHSGWIWHRAPRQCLHAVITPGWKTGLYLPCSTGAPCQSLLSTRRLLSAPQSCDTALTSAPRARLLPRPLRTRTTGSVTLTGQNQMDRLASFKFAGSGSSFLSVSKPCGANT